MTLTWTDSLSLSYAERPRGRPAARSRACRDPAGLRSRPADSSRGVRRRSREPLPRTGAEQRAGSLLVLVSCSIVQFDPSGRGPQHPRAADMEGAAAPGGVSRSATSTAQAETLDDRAVALDVGLVEVVQQPATLADQQQQPTTRVVVVLVRLEV